MNIPEDVKIPAIVFTLQAVMLTGAALILLLLLPTGVG